MGKPEGHISQTRPKGKNCPVQGGKGEVTSHIFLSLKHHKGIASMGLFLLVRPLMRMGISDNANLPKSV